MARAKLKKPPQILLAAQQRPAPEPEADPVAQTAMVVHGLDADLIATFKIFRMAAAFELILEHRKALAKVNEDLNDEWKRKGNTIFATLQGKKIAIEQAIATIYATFGNE